MHEGSQVWLLAFTWLALGGWPWLSGQQMPAWLSVACRYFLHYAESIKASAG